MFGHILVYMIQIKIIFINELMEMNLIIQIEPQINQKYKFKLCYDYKSIQCHDAGCSGEKKVWICDAEQLKQYTITKINKHVV